MIYFDTIAYANNLVEVKTIADVNVLIPIPPHYAPGTSLLKYTSVYKPVYTQRNELFVFVLQKQTKRPPPLANDFDSGLICPWQGLSKLQNPFVLKSRPMCEMDGTLRAYCRERNFILGSVIIAEEARVKADFGPEVNRRPQAVHYTRGRRHFSLEAEHQAHHFTS
ncbi:hypothetical protein CEXT_491851 [Caerostris extrusa]|uniref:Uncharacterized protein n=1 Tax=Caerostris extrusa TaxID=172846 RepID=A0AAV4URT3_CAEEX|nr:hypothetical protein CEXT_491851 [Caerostris extrusa]